MSVIVIVDHFFLQTIDLAVTIQIAQALFLLGVDTDHWVAGTLILSPQASDFIELVISFFKLAGAL